MLIGHILSTLADNVTVFQLYVISNTVNMWTPHAISVEYLGFQKGGGEVP